MEKKPSAFKLTAPIILAIIAIALVGSVAAVLIVTAPEHVTGTPEDKPTPTPTATVEPTAPPPTYEVHLSSNNTTPFYKGDTLRMTVEVKPPVAGATITLYNNGALAANPTQLTDASGRVTYDRNPTQPYDYTVTANIP